MQCPTLAKNLLCLWVNGGDLTSERSVALPGASGEEDIIATGWDNRLAGCWSKGLNFLMRSRALHFGYGWGVRSSQTR